MAPPTTVDDLLTAARARLERLSPAAAHDAQQAGAAIVDIRGDDQRAAGGLVPGAHVIARNVLEWRLDPACAHRDRTLAVAGARVVLLCHEGYQSSLAAATLLDFGLDATDVAGGFEAWRTAGLPVTRPHGPGVR